MGSQKQFSTIQSSPQTLHQCRRVEISFHNNDNDNANNNKDNNSDDNVNDINFPVLRIGLFAILHLKWIAISPPQRI